MNNDKDNWQHDSHQKHKDAATLVDEKVPEGEGGKHDHGGVLLLHSLHLGLLARHVVQQAKECSHCDDTHQHLARVQEGNDFKDDEGREEIVGLIIEEVADESALR